MTKILMILTSHRLDCFKLTMDLLVATDSLVQFDKVVLMLNGVVGRHLAYVQQLMASHSEVSWDIISGPRGKGPRVANLQNECVKRYPDSLYFKMDEDLFVPPGWVDKLLAAYEEHKDDPQRALITPVVANNATGFHYLLTAFPELKREYETLFSHPLTPEVNGPVWGYPQVAEWITRKFLDLRSANVQLEAHAKTTSTHEFFDWRFSINCLVYDYRHWEEMGGIPDDEEPAWGQWVSEHGKHNILATNTMLHHYSFFVQQDWLDRSSLLEDLRLVNIPDSLPAKSLTRYHLPRWTRMAKQVPGILKRRLGGTA